MSERLRVFLKISTFRHQRITEASNAMFVLWSRDDDPERRHLVDEQDQLRRVIPEKAILTKICEQMRIHRGWSILDCHLNRTELIIEWSIHRMVTLSHIHNCVSWYITCLELQHHFTLRSFVQLLQYCFCLFVAVGGLCWGLKQL